MQRALEMSRRTESEKKKAEEEEKKAGVRGEVVASLTWRVLFEAGWLRLRGFQMPESEVRAAEGKQEKVRKAFAEAWAKEPAMFLSRGDQSGPRAAIEAAYKARTGKEPPAAEAAPEGDSEEDEQEEDRPEPKGVSAEGAAKPAANAKTAPAAAKSAAASKRKGEDAMGARAAKRKKVADALATAEDDDDLEDDYVSAGEREAVERVRRAEAETVDLEAANRRRLGALVHCRCCVKEYRVSSTLGQLCAGCGARADLAADHAAQKVVAKGASTQTSKLVGHNKALVEMAQEGASFERYEDTSAVSRDEAVRAADNGLYATFYGELAEKVGDYIRSGRMKDPAHALRYYVRDSGVSASSEAGISLGADGKAKVSLGAPEPRKIGRYEHFVQAVLEVIVPELAERPRAMFDWINLLAAVNQVKMRRGWDEAYAWLMRVLADSVKRRKGVRDEDVRRAADGPVLEYRRETERSRFGTRPGGNDAWRASEAVAGGGGKKRSLVVKSAGHKAEGPAKTTSAAPTREARAPEAASERTAAAASGAASDTSKLCFLWEQQGACRYGDSCRFQHQGRAGQGRAAKGGGAGRAPPAGS